MCVHYFVLHGNVFSAVVVVTKQITKAHKPLEWSLGSFGALCKTALQPGFHTIWEWI